VDKSKEAPTQTQKAKAKKVDRMEESLKTLNRDLSMIKMKSMFAIGISMIALFGYLNSMYLPIPYSSTYCNI
jgi:calcium load-activated calcium channel